MNMIIVYAYFLRLNFDSDSKGVSVLSWNTQSSLPSLKGAAD